MRAGGPVLSAGRRRRNSCALNPRRRFKSPAAAEDAPPVPVLLLQDMNLCYRLLRQLVPGLPPGRAVSRVEILQRVIDYILELQTELDASCPSAGDHEKPLHCERPQQRQPRPQSGHSSGTDIHTGQSSEFAETC